MYKAILNHLPPSAIAQQLHEDGAAFLKRWGLTSRWMDGQLSNFEYLLRVNQIAGRSFQDITQYPVFPWMFTNYYRGDFDVLYAHPHSFR